jgi:predicted esterase
MSTQIIHENQPTLTHGTPLDQAKSAVILLHGRGATAQSMLDLAARLPADGVAYLIPQAANNTWYPNSGFGALDANQPYLSSALVTIQKLLDQINAAGISTDKTVIGGFSQGACLASEFVTQNVTRYRGVVILSGALMGPDDRNRSYTGSLAETPVFIGGADNDSWVKGAQLRQTADILAKLGGNVTIEVQSSSEHTIRASEIAQAAKIIKP